MDKTYTPQAIEQSWYQKWEEKGLFEPQGQGTPYCIMLPPPNVTGRLHMGHAFQDTIMDILTRYHRMKGDNTLWQPGTDHAGIATQMVVERQLNAEGKTRHDIGRTDFTKLVWTWKAESGGAITSQLRRMGTSMDWRRERFTMDEGLSEAVKRVFVQLHDEGLIYRGKRLVNWDPVLHTAVSDLEVLSEEEKGHLWHFSYPLTDGSGSLVVATTRPETMLGDSAVAVHPEDERYQAFIGKTITLPLVGREIPIIADEYVDKEFGTGCVKITPAHDFNDYEMGQRHNLPLHNIFTIDATINEQAPEKYRGLDRYKARDVILSDLEALGLLVKIDDHTLMVPRGDRSNAVIEPLLTDQWYVKADVLAEPAVKAVKEGSVKFIPSNWDKTFFNWMDGIQDWCISRQIWWGHRIPAWYDDNGGVYVGHDEDDVRQKYQLDASIILKQDEDVLDTWFSSALWPFSTLGWPEKTEALDTWYPTSVLVTGFDIIFFWVARMMMMGIKFMDDVPFKEIYIHGLVRDAHGQKMSKSKGNVLDPIDIIDGIDLESLVAKRTAGMMQPKLAEKIEKATRKEFADGIEAHGTDALRFTFASLATTGRDINFDMNRIAGYRSFCNKLWNAARYVLMNTQDHDTGIHQNEMMFSLADKWIQSELQHCIKTMTHAIDSYRFDLASNALYEFIWDTYCGWYLELSKPTLTADTSSDSELRGTRYTLVNVLEQICRLAHPIMPFITEEIWQQVAPLSGVTGDSIMIQPYPVPDNNQVDEAAINEMNWVMPFVTGIRSIRSQMNVPPKKKVPVLLKDASDKDRFYLERNRTFLMSLAGIETIEILEGEEPAAATTLVGQMEILIPMAGLIDKEAEIARLEKELAKLDKVIKQSSGKLANANYLDKAPVEVVNKEKEKLAELQENYRLLEMSLDKLK